MTPNHLNIYFALIRRDQERKERPFTSDYAEEDLPGYELIGDEERGEASRRRGYVDERRDDTPTEDGVSDRFSGIVDERDVRRNYWMAKRIKDTYLNPQT